jgi:hypothetical protein
MTTTSVERLEKLVGQEYAVDPVSPILLAQINIILFTSTPTTQVGWNKRDLLTYAVGIGAKTSETQFVYGTLFPLSFPPNSEPPSLTLELGTSRCFLSLPCAQYLPVDPSFAAFPTYPVVFFLKGMTNP